MVAKDKMMRVACCVFPDGYIEFVPEERRAIKTVAKEWSERQPKELRVELGEAKTFGGVVVIGMLSSDYFKMDPKKGHLK